MVKRVKRAGRGCISRFGSTFNDRPSKDDPTNIIGHSFIEQLLLSIKGEIRSTYDTHTLPVYTATILILVYIVILL